MTTVAKPGKLPANPHFSSGPLRSWNRVACMLAGLGAAASVALAQGEAWLAGHVAGLWGRRGDRYSEIRGRPQAPRKHIEMYLIGG